MFESEPGYAVSVMQFRRNLTAASRATCRTWHLSDARSCLPRFRSHMIPGASSTRLFTSSARLFTISARRFAIAALLPGLILSVNPARAATLHYDAFLSGLPIGSAVVDISVSKDAYRIAGTAASQGVAHLFSDWRSDFLAAGQLQNGTPALASYAYDEREKKKHRVLWLSAGTVRHVKNGQVRPSHPVRTGTDILTAFFLQGDCWRDRQLHTGRYSYRVTGRSSSEGDGCHFEVSDSDGDRSRFHVRFGEHDGIRVPIEARSKGLLRARIKLRPVTVPPPEDQNTVDMLLAEHP